jgi:hypothetical protein
MVDSKSTTAATNAPRPWPSYLFFGFALLFVVIWSIEVVPLFFQAPHAMHVCSKGGCTVTPASEYFEVLAVWSAVLLVLAGFLSYLGFRIGRK